LYIKWCIKHDLPTLLSPIITNLKTKSTESDMKLLVSDVVIESTIFDNKLFCEVYVYNVLIIKLSFYICIFIY